MVSQLRARPPRTTSVVFIALPSRSFRLPLSIVSLSDELESHSEGSLVKRREELAPIADASDGGMSLYLLAFAMKDLELRLAARFNRKQCFLRPRLC